MGRAARRGGGGLGLRRVRVAGGVRVSGRAHLGLCKVRVGREEARDAEIAELDVALMSEEDVACLQVAV